MHVGRQRHRHGLLDGLRSILRSTSSSLPTFCQRCTAADVQRSLAGGAGAQRSCGLAHKTLRPWRQLLLAEMEGRYLVCRCRCLGAAAAINARACTIARRCPLPLPGKIMRHNEGCHPAAARAGAGTLGSGRHRRRHGGPEVLTPAGRCGCGARRWLPAQGCRNPAAHRRPCARWPCLLPVRGEASESQVQVQGWRVGWQEPCIGRHATLAANRPLLRLSLPAQATGISPTRFTSGVPARLAL